MIAPLDFAAYLDIAISRRVDEFTIGDLAVKFAPRAAPPVREKKEPEPAPSALEMLDRQTVADTDVVTMPKLDGEAAPATPGTNIQWADDEPHPTKE